MKNILFVYSSLKDERSETGEVNYLVSKKVAGLNIKDVNVELYWLHEIYNENPAEIAELVSKAFKAIDKKNLSLEQVYREKLLILARYTKRLVRDLERANEILTHKRNTIKIFIRDLRRDPVVPYNERIHKMVTVSNPFTILERYRIHLDSLGAGERFSYEDLSLLDIQDIYSSMLCRDLGVFEEFLNLYIANKFTNEFLCSDTIVIGAPIYNHNIPSRLQNYLNYWARSGVTFRYNNPDHQKHDFFKKKMYVTVACSTFKEEYSNYVDHFFRLTGTHLGMRDEDIFISVLGNRPDVLNLDDPERNELAQTIAEKIAQECVESVDSPMNIQKIYQYPDAQKYPRLESFSIFYQLNVPPEQLGETLADNELDLKEHLPFNVAPEDVDYYESDNGKKSLVSVAFTNFVYGKKFK